MKQFGAFLKTTTLGGLFVLLPVVVVFHLLRQVFQVAEAAARPIDLGLFQSRLLRTEVSSAARDCSHVNRVVHPRVADVRDVGKDCRALV